MRELGSLRDDDALSKLKQLKADAGKCSRPSRGIREQLPLASQFAGFIGSVAQLSGVQRSSVNLQRHFNIVEDAALPAVKDQRAIAIFRMVSWLCDAGSGSVAALLEQFDVAFALEVPVADHDHLVDRVAIELDRQRQSEGQAGAHASGVGFDRHP